MPALRPVPQALSGPLLGVARVAAMVMIRVVVTILFVVEMVGPWPPSADHSGGPDSSGHMAAWHSASR